MSAPLEIELPCCDLQPGMKIAREVKDRSGRLLVPLDSIVTEKLLRILKMWGIQRIMVAMPVNEAIKWQQVGQQSQPSVLLDDKQINLHCQRLFRHSDLTQPVMRQLYSLIEERIRSGKQPIGN